MFWKSFGASDASRKAQILFPFGKIGSVPIHLIILAN